MIYEKLGWAFVSFCAGLVMPPLAVFTHFALGLSDWSPLDREMAKPISFAVPATVALILIYLASHYSRAAKYALPALLLGVLVSVLVNFSPLPAPSFI